MSRFCLQERFKFILPFLLLIFSCAGIGGERPDIVSNTKVNGTLSNADVRRIVVDQPFLISGDYFRQRPTPKDTIDLKRFFNKSEKLEQRVAKLEKELEGKNRPESRHVTMSPKVVKSRVKATSGIFNQKIGIIVLDKNYYLKNEISNNINLLSPAYNFLFFSDAQLRELLAPTDCLTKRDMQCVVNNLSLYPGIRFLIVIDNAKLSSSFPKKLSLDVKIIDTGLNYSYKIIDTTKEFNNDKELKLYLKQISDGILKFSHKKKSIMGWYGRIFAIKKDKYYVNSGKASGLKVGDLLKVVKYEEPLLAPTGVPVAWSPGDSLGKIKVVRLIGEDVSECIKVEGESGFKIGDFVIR